MRRSHDHELIGENRPVTKEECRVSRARGRLPRVRAERRRQHEPFIKRVPLLAVWMFSDAIFVTKAECGQSYSATNRNQKWRAWKTFAEIFAQTRPLESSDTTQLSDAMQRTVEDVHKAVPKVLDYRQHKRAIRFHRSRGDTQLLLSVPFRQRVPLGCCRVPPHLCLAQKAAFLLPL